MLISQGSSMQQTVDSITSKNDIKTNKSNKKEINDNLSEFAKRYSDAYQKAYDNIHKLSQEVSDVENTDDGETEASTQNLDPEDERQIIEKYYELIKNKNFEEAYALKYKPQMTLKEFENIYSDVRDIKLRYLFFDLDRHRFNIYYTNSDYDSVQYNVEMQVINGKLKTLIIKEDFVVNGNVVAYVNKEDDKLQVVVEKRGVKSVIDKGKAESENPVDIVGFGNLRLIRGGDMLLYSKSMWEYGGDVLYDIDNGKELKVFDYADFKTDSKEKFGFVCTSAGFGTGPGGSIYKLDGFREIYNLDRDFDLSGGNCEPKKCIMDVKCSYDENENVVEFVLYSDEWDGQSADEGKIAKVKFDLDSKEVKVKKY